jgi:hypothetical protein
MAPIVAWLTLYHVPRFDFVIHHPILKNRVFFCPLDPGSDLSQQETMCFSEGVHGKNLKTPRLG